MTIYPHSWMFLMLAARIDINQLAGDGGDFKQRSHNAVEVGKRSWL
jgi:hypothetical protein